MNMIKKLSLLYTRIGIFSLLLISIGCQQHPPAQTDEQGMNHGLDQSGDDRYAERVNSGMIKADTMKGSPARSAIASIGRGQVMINYRSPGIKGRIIWGGLIPYDQVWAAGAHHPTRIKTDRSLLINSVEVPKGDYALFLIPGRKQWTVILNTDYKQHMADEYDPKKDVLRFDVDVEDVRPSVSRLTYTVLAEDERKGKIVFEWEKIRIQIPVQSAER